MPGAVEACLGRYVSEGQTLVVGLSGGVDSLVLLHSLQEAAAERRLTLACVHVHHALSPNADRWADHCQRVCAARGIPLNVERVSVERGSVDGLEAAARRARHAVFARTPGDWIVLGHHRDDQAETLLFNLLRGTGLRGASAMAYQNGRLLRPLLDVGRDAIERCARERGLQWVEDESNADTRFSRNHLRHEVLAGLADRFPGSVANLAAAARRFGEAQALLDDLAVLDLGTHESDFPLDVTLLKSLPEQRARNVLRYLLHRRRVGTPSEERLREILRQLIDAAPDRHPAAVFGAWRISRRRGRIVLESVQDA